MTLHDELFARAQAVLPGGVSSPVRAFKSVGGTPRYMVGAGGAYIWGVEGERWVDFCLAWGPLILGHAPIPVVEAVKQAAERGLAFGTVSPGEIELGELIVAGFPRYNRVRLVCSGTEAVLTALRLARGATGRELILKFSGCYHGHADSMLVKAGSGLVSFGLGDSAGIPKEGSTIIAPLDDDAALEAAFTQYGDRLAAAIIEPLPANNGLLVQRKEWLQKLRQLCTQYGAKLIFDEVITGFRFGYHGYEKLVGIEPDLTTLGKIIGGGLPLAAVTGPAEILDLLAPVGPVYQAGTMAGNPIAVTAGIATLKVLKAGEVYARLEELGCYFDSLDSKICWVRQGPILWPYLGSGQPPRTDAAIDSSVKPLFSRIYSAWLQNGIYFPPSAFEVGFLCSEHTEAQLEKLVDIANNTL
jgi:glutamate-1-semialdehyde 2,1-aminomutase